MSKNICLAITGASGFIYAKRLLQCLLSDNHAVHLLVSDAATEVARLENGIELPNEPEKIKRYFLDEYHLPEAKLYCYGKTDWLAPVASGSAPFDAMVICPCSTGTLAAVANGLANNLIERAATVFLKENRRLVIVPREAPVSAIQLEHMHKLALMGVRIVPASPGFYQKPQSIEDLVDFMVARVLQQLDLPQSLLKAWGSHA